MLKSTHTKANTTKKVPERIMKHLAKKILKNLKEENGMIPKQVDVDIPNYKEIKEHKQAKETMKNYLEKLITGVKNEVDISTLTKDKKCLRKSRRNTTRTEIYTAKRATFISR